MHTETPFFYCIIKKLYQFFNQGKSISKLDKINPFQSNKKYFSTYHNIVDASTAIENAYSVHDTLSKILGDKMCFFETTKRDFKISPIDIIAYAFLKEELMLIPDSQSTQSLSTSFRNLQDFVTIFDKVFKEKKYPIYSNLKIDIEEIDMIIVPGLAFDREKNRLGRGAGFYDRFLKRINPPTKKIGIAFEFQVLENLPIHPPVDEKVDTVVSENFLI